MNTHYRLLHILPDEKVVDSFISILETVYPGDSLYVIYGETPSRIISKVKGNILFFQSKSKAFRDFLCHLETFERVFFHSLGHLRVFKKVKHPNITICIWGGDLYEALLARKGFKIYTDEDVVWKIRARNKKLPVCIYKFLVGMRDTVYASREVNLLKRSKFVYAKNCDIKLLRTYFPSLTFQSVMGSFSYYPIEKLVGERQLNLWCAGKNIWVNNSAAMNGNHISVFERLKGIHSSIKIYSPLSYGGAPFRAYIEKKGYEILGDKFYPIKDFLPPEEYYGLFLNVNSFVFGHYRQCAYGNILVALYLGAKCFFYKSNPLYNDLLSEGLIIFDLEKDFNESFALSPLSSSLRARNREIVMRTNSFDALMQQLRVSFK